MAHWFSTDLSRLFAPSPVPAPTAASVYWDLVAGEGRLGSWTRANRQDRVRALARFQGALYAGIGPAQAEVWRLTDRGWEQVGGNDIAGSWPARDPATRGGVGLRPGHVWVNALLSDERDCWLYAGVKDGQLGAQLWRYDGRTWEQIGGRGGRGDWVSTDQDHVYALAWHQGKLYVGMQGHMTAFNVAAHDTAGVIRSAHGKGYHPGLGNGEIYRYDNGHWTCVAGRGRAGSWDENHAVTWVYALCSLGEELYAAIGRHAVRDLRWIGEVWRLRSGCRAGGWGWGPCSFSRGLSMRSISRPSTNSARRESSATGSPVRQDTASGLLSKSPFHAPSMCPVLAACRVTDSRNFVEADSGKAARSGPGTQTGVCPRHVHALRLDPSVY